MALTYKPLLDGVRLIEKPGVFQIHAIASADGFLGYASLCRAISFDQLSPWRLVEETEGAHRRLCPDCSTLALRQERAYQRADERERGAA